MRKLPVGRLAIVLALLAAPVHAIQVPGLYEAAVSVSDQSPTVREQALQQALERVLVRVTGSTQVGGDPALVPILARAPSLILGYGYENEPAGPGLRLRARFDPRAVEAAVREQGLPVWGANRLSHLVWLAIKDDGPRALLDRKSAAARAAPLLEAADARGIALVFPEMIPAERRLAEFQKVWRGEFDGLADASPRYAADEILIGRVGREGGQWVGRWSLLEGGLVTEEWSSAQPTVGEALAEGLHQLADREARQFAVRTLGYVDDVVLAVTGVRSLADYGRTLNYLRGLNPVRTAGVDRIEGERVIFRLRIEGDPSTLERILAAGRQLERRPDEDQRAIPSYVLVR